MGRKIIGGVLVVALIAALAFVFFSKRDDETPIGPVGENVALTGVVGSEKKAFFEDQRVIDALATHGLSVSISTAGSRQIATTTDLSALDFVFPSSAPAAQKITSEVTSTGTYSPFFSPMAVATYKPIVDLLAQNGIASQDANGVWSIDMAAYLAMVKEGKRWSDLEGAGALYNSPRSVLISSTDIRKSNSAAMYLSIASYVENNNSVLTTAEQQQALLPSLSALFLAQGFSASSSEEPFNDYLSQGIGAFPMVMIYEAQFVGEAASETSRITPEMVLAYPTPTVFSKHTLIALDEKANLLGELLSIDPTLTALEAEYGFRTSDNAAFAKVATDHGIVVQNSLTNIADTPSYDVLESLITSISDQYNQ